MYSPARTFALCLAIVVALPLSAAEKIDLDRVTPVPDSQPIPVQDFFRPLLLQEPELNPSGTHIIAIVTIGEDRHDLLIYELKTKKVDGVRSFGDRDIYSVTWLDDRQFIFELSARKMYGVGMFGGEITTSATAFPLLQYYGSRLVTVPLKDRLHPLVWNSYDVLGEGVNHDLGVARISTSVRNGSLVNLLAADASSAMVEMARNDNERHILRTFPSPKGLVTGYMASRLGELEFAFTGDDGRPVLHHFDGKTWSKCAVDLEEIDIIGHGDEPGQLIVRGPRQEGKPRALQIMDGVTGKLGEVLLQDAEYDFYAGGISDGWLYRDPVENRILGAVFQRNGPRVVWFEEHYRALQKILDGFFPKQVVRIIGSDQAQKLFLVATYSDRQPVIYSWVDLEARTAGLIKTAAPWIDPKRMQPMNILKFTTVDGRKLDAYLTLPAGATKQNPPPLIVLPHGGPWARDSWGFDSEVQFLASRGYAVLQPNYRGSNGYCWMFPESDTWDFLKMHQDVTAATRTMIKSGLIDPDRVAIMGASFGGYLAVQGVVSEPSLYRCAVTLAGVFDWAQHIRDKKYDQYDTPVYGRLMMMLGDPAKNRERFDAMSPGHHVDQIRVPVFVSGGKDDRTVEIEQSRNLIAELKRHQVPHEVYIVGDEGHGFAHLSKQVELYTRIEAFLAKNLAPRGGTATATPAAP